MNNDLHINEFNDFEPKSTEAYIPKLSMEYVLSRIDAILNHKDYIHEAIKAITEIQNPDHSSGLKAEAISQTVSSREETNQKLIQLFEKMYDDLKPKEQSEEILRFKQLAEMLKDFPPEISADIISKSAQQMFVKPATAVVM